MRTQPQNPERVTTDSSTHDAMCVRGLTQRFATPGGGLTVFQDLSFNVREGELLCIMGPNGAGKTTLLRLLDGLDRPTSGAVDCRGSTRLMFQDNDLFPWLTVHDNLLLGRRTSTYDAATYRQKMERYLELVGLTDRQDAYPHQLSGGNRQRVAIVRCFLSGADVLLLDEPFSHLDPISRGQLQLLIRRLWSEERRTVVVVTHDVHEAVALASRILVLSGTRGAAVMLDVQESHRASADRDENSLAVTLVRLLERQEDFAPLAASGARGQRRLRLTYLLSPLLLLALWDVASLHGYVDSRFFPAPSVVLYTLQTSLETGQMVGDIRASLYRLVLGMVIGGGIGFALGMVMGVHRLIRVACEPLIALVYPLPKIALVPLFLIAFGTGEASKVATLSIGAFFLMQMNTLHGVDEVQERFADTIRSLGLRGWDYYGRALLRGALPSIVTGVRAATGYCLVLLVAAEFTAADAGIGYAIWHAWELYDIELMYAGLLVLATFGLMLFFVLDEVLARIPWRSGRSTSSEA